MSGATRIPVEKRLRNRRPSLAECAPMCNCNFCLMDEAAARIEEAERERDRMLDERDGMDWLLDRWLRLYPASIADRAVEAVQEPIREAGTAMAKLRIALDDHRMSRRAVAERTEAAP